jgi:hypothetical protein
MQHAPLIKDESAVTVGNIGNAVTKFGFGHADPFYRPFEQHREKVFTKDYQK